MWVWLVLAFAAGFFVGAVVAVAVLNNFFSSVVGRMFGW